MVSKLSSFSITSRRAQLPIPSAMNSTPTAVADCTHLTLFASDSEQQIISLLLEGKSEWLPSILQILPDPMAFVDGDRRTLWRAIIEMRESGMAVSHHTLAVWLRQNSSVTDSDKLIYAQRIDHAIHSPEVAKWHAQQVALAHARRVASAGMNTISNSDLSPGALASDLRGKLELIEGIALATSGDSPLPKPLKAQLDPVKPFDPEWLPCSLKIWITDIADRMQCPPDFPAVAAMCALSSVAGRRFCIQPKQTDESWHEFPTLWAMLIGRPSLMKSPAMQATMRPLRGLERAAFEEFEERERGRKADQIEAKLKLQAMESKAKTAVKKGEEFDYESLIPSESESAPCRRFIVNDASLEALGEVLRDNPSGTLLYQDELAGLLAMLEKDGNQALRAFLLQSWSGKESFTFDRIGRGTRRVESCAVSVLGSIQPGVIASHVRAANGTSAGADGFLQRFSLMVWPDMPAQWHNIDRRLDHKAEEEATSVFTTIETLCPVDFFAMGAVQGRDGIPTFRFAPDAQERFRAWHQQLENRLRIDNLQHSLEAHLAKYRKLVPSLALLIHVAEWQIGPVSLSALERALSWANYLESHANRVYKSDSASSLDAAASLLQRLRVSNTGLPDDFTARQVYRKGWSGLARPDDAEAACEVLVDHGWLIATPQPTSDRGGRPTFLYRLNPRAREGRSAVA